jgi:hypothetical protein
MGTQAAARINNLFARLHTRKIFLAGMAELQKSYIRAYIPDSYLIEIDSVDDVAGILDKIPGVDSAVLPCKSFEVIEGLAIAKFSNRRLRIDENAHAISFAMMNPDKSPLNSPATRMEDASSLNDTSPEILGASSVK